MKNLLLSIVLFTISFFSYSQKNIDTVFVISVEQKTDYNDTTFYVKTSDSNGFICKSSYLVGDVFCYYDTQKNQYITKKDYENSLFDELYDTEYYKLFSETKPVKCTKVKKVLKNKYKYKVSTDCGVTFFTNFAPSVNEVVFLITKEGKLILN
jgi:hypothetical protein